MTCESVTEELFSQLEERGYKGRIVSIQHLRDLQEEIEKRHRQGLFDEQFYQESLTSFVFSAPDTLPKASSLIVIAVPRSQFQVVFTWQGESVSVLVPPFYLCWREAEKQLKDTLARVLSPFEHRVTEAALPRKLLAARSGLGQYGRNNICYVPGMGSLHRLVAYYSDLVCQEDNWQAVEMMARCQDCTACLRKCPSGAITSERFLLHAERCITFHNEQPGDVPFPTWMDPSWHNCLIGCLCCQKFCPENKDFWRRVERGAEFSEEETALLLEGVPPGRLPAATLVKLERLDLTEYASLLPRNLSALLGSSGT